MKIKLSKEQKIEMIRLQMEINKVYRWHMKNLERIEDEED